MLFMAADLLWKLKICSLPTQFRAALPTSTACQTVWAFLEAIRMGAANVDSGAVITA